MTKRLGLTFNGPFGFLVRRVAVADPLANVRLRGVGAANFAKGTDVPVGVALPGRRREGALMMSRRNDEQPEAERRRVEDYWALAIPRGEAAMARARQIAPSLTGLTPDQVRLVVAADTELSLRFLEPGAIRSAEAAFGRINATVVDGLVTRTDVG